MTAGAATVTFMVALWLGIYGAKWVGAENDEAAARARLAAAKKAMWHARRVIVAVVLIAMAAADVWIRNAGR